MKTIAIETKSTKCMHQYTIKQVMLCADSLTKVSQLGTDKYI